MVVEHKHKIGFRGTILIEPKPLEPTKHQYDYDVATVYGVPASLRPRATRCKVNIEVNHATLAGPQLRARGRAPRSRYGIFGSIDMNRGDPQNGWDTDQFPNNVARNSRRRCYELIRAWRFHARAASTSTRSCAGSRIDPQDLFTIAHIGGMDTLARALIAAAKITEDGRLADTEVAALRRLGRRSWVAASKRASSRLCHWLMKRHAEGAIYARLRVDRNFCEQVVADSFSV